MPKQVAHALGLHKHPHTNLPANPIPPISKTRRKPTDAPSAVVEPRLRRRRPETQAEPEAPTDETAEELARLRHEITQMKAEKAAAQTRLQKSCSRTIRSTSCKLLVRTTTQRSRCPRTARMSLTSPCRRR